MLPLLIFLNLIPWRQTSRIVCPAFVVMHTDFCTHLIIGDSSTFAQPVIPSLHRQSFPIAPCLFRLLWRSFFISDCSWPFSDCSVPFPISLAFFSGCSVTLSDCSVSFPLALWWSFLIARQLLPIALTVFSDCQTNILFYADIPPK